MTALTLYSRRACPLCDDMMLDLDAALRGRELTYVVVDIDSDPDLASRFANRIPVLAAGDRELCYGRLDPDCLPD